MDPDNLPKFVFLHNNHKYRLKLGFYAAPSNPKLFSKTVRDELTKLKFTYCSDLNGLIMGFGKISSNELIQADTRHCISVAVYVDVYIFRPPVGSILEAVVNQTSDNHVSCLVHNIFNVSIVRPEHLPCDQWSGSKIKKNDKINVKVLSFDLTKKLPHITGEIVFNESDECVSPKNVLNIYSGKSSSSEEFVSDFIKSFKHGKKEDDTISLKHSSSDSESSSKTNMVITHSKKLNTKSISSSTLLNNSSVNNSKLMKNLFGSSTPISNSDHSIDNLNSIKNKQIEQLQKHLAKNSTEKRKSSASIKSLNPVAKNSIFQPSNNYVDKIKINEKNHNELDLLASSVNSNENSESDITIHQQSKVVQSDSGISGDEHAQNKFSKHNLFSNIFQNSPKNKKKPRTSDKIVSAILHSLSPNKNKSDTSIVKQLLFDPSSNDNEMNNVYIQRTLGINNSEKEMLNDYKSPIKPTLRLSTKRIEKSNSPKNINPDDSKNQIKSKSTKQYSNDIFSMTFDSESSSSSDDIKSAVTNIINSSKFNESVKSTHNCMPIEESELFVNKTVNIFTEPKQNVSKIEDTEHLTNESQDEKLSDVHSTDNDDEICTKLKQNISIIENSKCTDDKTQNKKCMDLHSSDDDEVYTKLKHNISKIENKKSLTEKTQNRKVHGTSSSDDAIFTNYKQSISKIENTKPLTDKTQDQKYCNAYCNDNDSNSSDGLNKYLDCLKLMKLNETNSIHISETDEFTKSKKKRIEFNDEKSELLQSPKNSCNKSIVSSNITSSKNYKSEIMKHILANDSSSDDEIECNLSNKNNITDEYKLMNKIDSDRFQTSKVNFDKTNSSALNKEISNPFIKFYSGHSTSSSSEDDSFIINLTKSKSVKNTSKKMNTKVVKEEDTKNILIQQVLSSVKHKDKTPKQWLEVENITSDISNDISKSINIKQPNKNKLTVKNNKKTLEKLRNSIDVPNSNKSIINLSQIDFPMQLNTQSHTDNNSDDEVDFMKQILNKQKLNVTEFTDILEATNLKKLKTHNEASESKFVKKPSVLPKDKLISDRKKTIKDRPRKTKDILLKKNQNLPLEKNESLIDNIINSIENSSSIHSKIKKKKKSPKIINEINDLSKNMETNVVESSSNNFIQTKKKKKDHNLLVGTNVSLIDNIINSIENASSIHSKMKKKKKSPKRINEMNDLSKNNETTVMESFSSNFTQTKKKKKDINLPVETHESLIDNVINSIENSSNIHSKIKKKKKSPKLINERNGLSKNMETNVMESSSNNFTQIKKKKKDQDLTFEKNESLIDNIINSIENSCSIHSKIKKKKKSPNLINETNDLSKNMEANVMKSASNNFTQIKKKKKDCNLLIETNESLIDNVINSIENPSSINTKIKNKKKSPNLVNETNDLSKNNKINVIESSSSSFTQIKKKKKDHNLLSESNKVLTDNVIDAVGNSSNIHTKIKKKKKSPSEVNETNDLLKKNITNVEKDSSSNPTLAKKKKKHHSSTIETNDLLMDNMISAVEFSPDIHTKIKKEKKGLKLIIDEAYDMSKDKNYNVCLSKIKKKKHNDSLVKNEEQSISVREEDTSTTKKKKIRVTSDITENNTRNTINNKLIEVNTFYDNNDKSHKKTGVNKKKKKELSISRKQIESILASQNSEVINNLKNLYSSLNI